MPASKDPMKYPTWMIEILNEPKGNKELFRITLPRKKAAALRSQFYGFLSAITNHSGFEHFHPRARELTTRLDYHPDDSVTLTVVDRDLAIDPLIEAALADMRARRPTTPQQDPSAIPSTLPQLPLVHVEPPVEPPARELESVPIPHGATVQQRQAYPQEHCYRFNLVQLIEHMPAGAIPYWLIDMWKDEHPEFCTDKPTFMTAFHSHFKSGELAKWWDNKRVNLQAVLNSENINANT